ncbi:MAG: SAM-dependent DNA methyltransferase [Gemmatimonadaceae bacterium]|nr:SAM-dependent DNA methyltransferase [Gemmatimonadaceae bacterium]
MRGHCFTFYEGLQRLGNHTLLKGPQQVLAFARSDRHDALLELDQPMNYVKSKQRVADHGEVFTPPWLVEAMLDLVKGESERIDARFLEPACGSGNFLVRILQRKLAAVETKVGKSDFEKRHFALLAVMCIYGIELLADNIAECRANMQEILAGVSPKVS